MGEWNIPTVDSHRSSPDPVSGSPESSMHSGAREFYDQILL
jgi:hypothetical protein